MPCTYQLQLDGVACGGCIAVIQQAFDDSQRVKSAEFNLDARTASVTTELTPQLLIELVTAAGYGASLMES